MRKFVSTTLVALALVGSAYAATLANPLITVDENGNGSLLFPGGVSIPAPGVLKADPGPGGSSSALTYNLLGPPSLVAGDVFLSEPGGDSLSDMIRFNPAGTGTPAYPASLVFYSDTRGGVDALGDTGFPASFYENRITKVEVGSEGSNGFIYTPTADQPGFIAGFAVSYNIISDSSPVPEPASMSLVILAGGLLLAGKGWMKRA